MAVTYVGLKYPAVYGHGGSLSYEDLILSHGPSLYWRLGTNGTTDLSGNGRDGTAGGGVTIGGAAGLVADSDGATTFDDSNDIITSSYQPFSAATARTFECWAKRGASPGSDDAFWGSGNGAEASLYLSWGAPERDIIFTPNGRTNSYTWTDAAPVTGTTFHCVLVFDQPGNSAELFINGVSAGAQAVAQDFASTTNTFIGGAGYPGFYFFKGVLDEMAVYERALTGAEILEHYETGAG